MSRPAQIDQMIAQFRSALLCCAAWITLALTAASQRRRNGSSAARVSVRIEVDSSPLVSGVVVRQSTDSLTLRAGGGALDYSVAFTQVRHVRAVCANDGARFSRSAAPWQEVRLATWLGATR